MFVKCVSRKYAAVFTCPYISQKTGRPEKQAISNKYSAKTRQEACAVIHFIKPGILFLWYLV
jgi:hypothetical protein